MRIKQFCSSLLCSLALVGLSVNCTQREPSSPESSPSMETTGTGTASDLGAGSVGGTDTSGDTGTGTMGTGDSADGALTDGTMGTTGTAGSTTGTSDTTGATGTGTDTTGTDTMSDTTTNTGTTAAHEQCKNLTGKAMDDCMKKAHAKGDKTKK